MTEDTHAARVDEPTDARVTTSINKGLRGPHVHRFKRFFACMDVEMDARKVMDNVDTLEKHPQVVGVTNVTGAVPDSIMPEVDICLDINRADLVAALREVNGQVTAHEARRARDQH
jgi:hypothetical protein